MPCLVMFSVGIVLVPLTAGLAGLAVGALIIGFAKGLGSGLNVTPGSELSPAAGRGKFLRLWKSNGGLGSTGGPLIVAAVASVATMGAAAAAVGAIGITGAVVLSKAVAETMQERVES